jgi:hypothetical protein
MNELKDTFMHKGGKSNMAESKRTFTIQGSDLGFEGGRYKGTLPSLAARKAAKQLFRMIENKDHKSEWKKYHKFQSYKKIKFILREISRGSDKGTHYYEGTVMNLPQPIVIKRGDVEITVTKKIHVKTCVEHSFVGSTPKTS